MTPSQAVAILAAMEDYWRPFGTRKWRSIANGAEARVRNALMDAGWSWDEDRKSWVNDGTP